MDGGVGYAVFILYMYVEIGVLEVISEDILWRIQNEEEEEKKKKASETARIQNEQKN